MARIGIKIWDKMPEEAKVKYPNVYGNTWGHIECPGCYRSVSISTKIHSIDDSGIMRPSLVCPYCPFHDFVFLEGYSNGITEGVKK